MVFALGINAMIRFQKETLALTEHTDILAILFIFCPTAQKPWNTRATIYVIYGPVFSDDARLRSQSKSQDYSTFL